MADLHDISTEALAAELASRTDLADAAGVMPLSIYQLIEKLSPIPYIDGVAVRRSNGVAEGMLIRRGTRRFAGRLCSIGGRIRRLESIEQALRRQFRTDVGCEIELLVPWNKPVDILQCVPVKEGETPPPDFGPEIGRHCTSQYYPVRLIGEPKFGNTNFGGQEAAAVEWYRADNLPVEDEFGYGQRSKILSCIRAAESLLPS